MRGQIMLAHTEHTVIILVGTLTTSNSIQPVVGALNPSFAAGSFELPIAEISTYLAQPVTPRIVHVSSAGVTRPDRPGIDVEQVR